MSGKNNTDEGKSSADDNSNRIDNRFDNLLIYPKKNVLLPFELVDHFENKFTNEQFKNKFSLIFTGYTNCPDVCPNTLNQLSQLYNQMEESTRDKIQFVFFSVDPDRDNPTHIRKYLDFFNAKIIGITGKVPQIDGLIKNLGGIYSINREEGEYYTVDHSARIFIVGPNADRFGIIDHTSFKAKDKAPLIADLTALVNE